jgi:hypothetical protein
MLLQRRRNKRISITQTTRKAGGQYPKWLIVELMLVDQLATLLNHNVVSVGVNRTG